MKLIGLLNLVQATLLTMDQNVLREVLKARVTNQLEKFVQFDFDNIYE